MLALYNTLTRTKEVFEPEQDLEVKLYTCGPTVYNYYHIGNLRNAVFNDTLRRVLEDTGFTVKHVMNITDVGHLVSDADEGEDKLETGAKREGKTVWEVAKQYTDAFKRDMESLNVLRPSVDPARKSNTEQHDPYARATDFIPEQIEMVRLLLEKDFAYITQQAIYFDVSKLPDYGTLSGQKLSEKELAVRSEVVTDPEKRSVHDFAVWFFAVGHFAGHSMQWESSWGKGFPGWHLECSAIIHTLLGDPIDIHTGGVDHIGTHHPNEMAQTEAAFGHPLSRFWVHNEFILVDGTKMSKSKGNSFLLEDVTKKGFSPLDLRVAYLGAQYRTQMNFTWESLDQARKNRLTLMNTFERLKEKRGRKNEFTGEGWLMKVREALLDDLNTPLALTYALELSREINGRLDKNDGIDAEKALKIFDTLFFLFGLKEEMLEIPDEVKVLAEEREKVRQLKNFAASDVLRLEIEKFGFTVEDASDGYRLKKK